MGSTRTIHVVGTGTLGEPLISLLLNLQQDLSVDEITFHKNRPLLNDRGKINNLMQKGAKLVVEEEKDRVLLVGDIITVQYGRNLNSGLAECCHCLANRIFTTCIDPTIAAAMSCNCNVDRL